MRGPLRAAFAATLFSFCMAEASAGEADVEAARAEFRNGAFDFYVTVSHGDTGWDHFADAWEIVGPDGAVIATRELVHPHVNEQPFTRSLRGVEIPPEVTSVLLRARDKIHGLGGATVTVQLKRN